MPRKKTTPIKPEPSPQLEEPWIIEAAQDSQPRPATSPEPTPEPESTPEYLPLAYMEALNAKLDAVIIRLISLGIFPADWPLT